jgi:hypothetical protein
MNPSDPMITSLQPVTHASQPEPAALRANAILDFEMATLHSHFDSGRGMNTGRWVTRQR